MIPDRYSRLNQYRSMWILVFYDLPTNNKTQRKIASKFRKNLLEDGFDMFQFSIYLRFCPSRENADVHIKRTINRLPKYGTVGILQVTDKQFEMIQIFRGKTEVEPEKPPQQLELF